MHLCYLFTIKIHLNHKESKLLIEYPLQALFYLFCIEMLRNLRIGFVKAKIALDKDKQTKTTLIKAIVVG